jgi:hypothetical protein
MTSKQPNLLDPKLGHYKLTLERLSLTLASPYSQDKGNLDIGQAHEILSNVNHKLVHEGRGNVEPILHIVEVIPVPNSNKINKMATKICM